MSPLKNKKILITCGPTWVAIDEVRVLSNISSGELGHRLAESAIKAGAQVTLLDGQTTDVVKIKNKNLKIIKFKFFNDLWRLLQKELKKDYAVVIHAAAVSDFEPEKTIKGKINSSNKLTLALKSTFKIINRIKKINPDIFLVGFKLEPNLTEKNVFEKSKKLFNHSHCDLVVANSTNKNTYQAFIVTSQSLIIAKVKSRQQLVEKLLKNIP